MSASTTTRRRIRDLFRQSGRTSSPAIVETLESRVMLSGAVELPSGLEVVDWRDGQVVRVEDSWIMTFERGVTNKTLLAEFSGVIADLGIAIDGYIRRGDRFIEFTTPDPLNERAIDWARGINDDLVNIEPNVARAPNLVPNDPGYVDEYWLENTGQIIPGLLAGTPGADIDAERAWEITTGSSGVVIAVVDTGVEIDHEDLADNIWVNPSEIPGNGIDDDGNGLVDDINGWDFGTATFGEGGTGIFGGDNNPDDDAIGGGHGTAVAGTIGAVGNNGIGIAGVNWDVSILPVKIANQEGALVGGAIIAAHTYLTGLLQAGVPIAASNNSYGAFAPGFFAEFEDFDFERAAIEDFIAAGGTFVASAGNDSNDNDDAFTNFPAAYDLPGIISVAATDNRDELAGFSNFGETTVDVAAPGERILTTAVNNTYTFIDGTSFSGPIVAGIVGLMKAVRPDLTPSQVKDALIASSDPIPALQDLVVADGRVNAFRALEFILTDGPLVTQISPGVLTGAPVNQLEVAFNERLAPLGPGVLSSITLQRSGGDGTFGDGDEVVIPLAGATLDATGTVLTITPSIALGTLDSYRLDLIASGFTDLEGNFLNGDAVSGENETYFFDIVVAPGPGEPNDRIQSATPVIVPGGGDGSVQFSGRTIGDGLQAGLDVDLYRIDMPRGGLVTARVFAETLPTPSTLDGVLRLFDGNGNELAMNDQFFGNDPFIDFFLPSAGVYYVGVSGFGNESYRPLVAGSGSSQSLGSYNLTIDVALVGDATLVETAAFPIPGRPIPDQGTLIESIFIDDSRVISDLNVRIDIAHDFVSDLDISLIGPQGQIVTLANGIGGSADNFTNTIFDSEATRSIVAATPADAPFSGLWAPQDSLTVFNDTAANGLWRIVIRDTKGNDAGSLLEWELDLTLQNDIFGPFELNDTLTTARVVDPASATVTLNAFIGDGGFGVRDVDLFSFEAAAGSTLNIEATSGGVVDLALRLFDADGNELQASNPGGERDAAINGFVFVDGGSYIIGVSDSARAADPGAYDPTAVASGVDGETVGAYTLSLELASGVSDPSVSLSGSRLDAGITGTGVFGLDALGLSLGGIEFLPLVGGEPTRTAFFGLSSGGSSFINDGAGPSRDVPFNVTSQSTPANNRVVVSGVVDGFDVSRTISYAQDGSFLAIDVSLQNVAGRALGNVLWAEGFNPDQDFGGTGSLFTTNDVVDGLPLAVATGANGRSIAIGADATDTRASALFSTISGEIRDPATVLSRSVADPDGVSSDLTMALVYDLGQLADGESVSLRYFVFLSDAGAEPITGANGLYATANNTRADATDQRSGLLTLDPADVAADADGIADLAYRLFYPEGFANDRSSTFVPIVNPTDTDARVIVVARYETGVRDQVLFDGVVAANTRSPDALTITTPELFEMGNATNVFNPETGLADGVRKSTPYALEVRSSVPVAATISHFDFGFSTGEAFTATASELWSFANVSIGQGSNDFITFQNTSSETTKVSTFLFPENGGPATEIVFTLEGLRRGGWNLNAELASGVLQGLAPGNYGVSIVAGDEVVAAASSFDNSGGAAELGVPGLGATEGAIAEGQFGLSSDSETIFIVNGSSTQATVELRFVFDDGSAIRESVVLSGASSASVEVAELPLFPEGKPYAVFYESSAPVTVSSSTRGLGERLASGAATQAQTFWAFSEGFAPIAAGQVDEYLRLYNPGTQDALVEITLQFTDGSTETFRRVATAATVSEFDLRAFISPTRLAEAASGGGTGVFYGFTVKASSGVVAYQGRTDGFFGGSFGTLGIPLGISSGLA
ncbi:MAG: S8 family serine peptidase [Planctomycetota bacterium]